MDQNLKIYWFKAKDVIKKDNTPFKARELDSKLPLIWEEFSDLDCQLLEEQYQLLSQNPLAESKVAITADDRLFEVNLITYEYQPIYWEGPVYEVRRGVWFEPKGLGGAYIPCDLNLVQQLEAGYKKLWIHKETSTDNRWPLLGPHLNEFVVYSTDAIAYIQTDELSSKISRAMLKNQGLKIIRGWDVVLSLREKPAKKSLDKASEPTPEETAAESPTKDGCKSNRKINHLVFAIHGIGQKLSQHVDAMSFTNDCEIFRQSLKSCANNLRKTLIDEKHDQQDLIPEDGGIQVLPIQWREKLAVKIAAPDTDDDEEEHIALDDLLPEGIPGIRMLVSDVILDVLLYMTPKFRKEMIRHVSAELNRLYALFKSRNPDFDGPVSLYGHSLGSVIAYDVSALQNTGPFLQKVNPMTRKASSAEIDISSLLSPSSRPNEELPAEMDMLPEKLEFPINHLFTVGSPVGMFLLLGGIHIKSPIADSEEQAPPKHHSRPAVKALYNIFHPYDPVAHRMEPLYSGQLLSLRPVPIHYTKGGITQTVKGIGAAGNEIVERGRTMLVGIVSSAGTVMNSITRIRSGNIAVTNPELELSTFDDTDDFALSPERQPRRKSSVVSPTNSTLNVNAPRPRPNPSSRSEPDRDQRKVMQRLQTLNPHGRLDYVMQCNLLENQYLSSLGVHMSYWGDVDCNSLIIRSLYAIKLKHRNAT